MRFDVAVIGAGPAGCVAAARLAGTGARVALIDGSHPREKPCGGGVTGRALALLDGARFDEVPSVVIQSARFEYRSESSTVPLSQGPGGIPLAVVTRREFDQVLLQRAERAGASLIQARVTGLERSQASWSVQSRGSAVEADWILGADGPGSLVRKRVSVPFSRADLSLASGYYVHGVSSHEIAIEFLDNPPGYLWSFPRPDHLAVGACAQADGLSPDPLFTIVSRWIARNVAPGDVRVERYGWPIPSLGAAAIQREEPAGDRWMLLGDAAGMVDPITREGIYFAMLSGAAAATSLTLGGDPARRYLEQVRAAIYDELLRAARLKARFFQPHFMALLVSALNRSSRIRGIMADLVGEQSYKGLRRRLLGTFELSLFRELFGW